MALNWADFVWTYKRYLSLYGLVGPIAVTGTLGGPSLSITTGDGGPSEAAYQNTVSTTDGTATTIHSVTCEATTSTGFAGYIVARRTGGVSGTAEDGAFYQVQFMAVNIAGVATIVSSSVTAIAESQLGWDVSLTASGGNVLLKCTGASGNNIVWNMTGRVYTATT
jgi:hypothetical protein